MQNIAIIKQGTGRYLFSVPENVTLKEGDGEAWSAAKLGQPRWFVYWREPRKRNAAFLGGVFVMNGLTNIHWLLFGGFALAMTITLLQFAQPRDRSAWVRLLATLAIGWPDATRPPATHEGSCATTSTPSASSRSS